MKDMNEIGAAVYEKVQEKSIFLPLERKGYFPYLVGQIVKPSVPNDNGNVYRCTVAGVTGLGEPTWPGSGAVTDGSATWTFHGAIDTVLGIRILELCNEAIELISLSADLPALEAGDTVETVADTGYVALPDDYQRELFFCFNDTAGTELTIWANYQILRHKYHNMFNNEGPVSAVAIQGGNLHYQYIPVSTALETLSLNYFKIPTPLTAMIDEPDDLIGVEEFADNLLTDYVCAKCFNDIEQGLDGKKPNTAAHMAAFNAGLMRLRLHLGGQTKRVDSFRG